MQSGWRCIAAQTRRERPKRPGAEFINVCGDHRPGSRCIDLCSDHLRPGNGERFVLEANGGPFAGRALVLGNIDYVPPPPGEPEPG